MFCPFFVLPNLFLSPASFLSPNLFSCHSFFLLLPSRFPSFHFLDFASSILNTQYKYNTRYRLVVKFSVSKFNLNIDDWELKNWVWKKLNILNKKCVEILYTFLSKFWISSGDPVMTFFDQVSVQVSDISKRSWCNDCTIERETGPQYQRSFTILNSDLYITLYLSFTSEPTRVLVAKKNYLVSFYRLKEFQ